MKNSVIATVNAKGQLVIPKNIRQALGITSDVLLQVSLRGQGITIYPIDEVITKVKQENILFKILELTHGSWGDETSYEKSRERARRRREFIASKKGKNAW